jgi:hypothetical protein
MVTSNYLTFYTKRQKRFRRCIWRVSKSIRLDSRLGDVRSRLVFLVLFSIPPAESLERSHDCFLPHSLHHFMPILPIILYPAQLKHPMNCPCSWQVGFCWTPHCGWRIAVNILHKQSHTDDKGQFSSFAVIHRTNIPSPYNAVLRSCYKCMGFFGAIWAVFAGNNNRYLLR